MAAGLSFKITGDTTGLGRALGKAEGMVGRFGNSIKNIGLTGLAAGAAGAAASVAGLAFALKKSVDEAANLEVLEVQFASITGSAQGSADMISHLRKEAMRTGVDMQSMAIMVRRLMASGMDIDLSKKMTASLLDISGALGLSAEESKLLGIAISQVSSKGILSMEELRQQIAEKGVPVFDVMAQKLNVTKGEFMKMVADGKVGAEVLIEAFANLEGPLAKFRGGANRMALTLTGSFNRLKAAIRDAFFDVGEGKLSPLASAVDAMTSKIAEWKPMIQEFGKAVGDAVKVFVEAFSAGKVNEIIKLSFVIAAKEFSYAIIEGVTSAIRMLFEGATSFASFWFKVVTTPLRVLPKMAIAAGQAVGILSKALGQNMKIILDSYIAGVRAVGYELMATAARLVALTSPVGRKELRQKADEFQSTANVQAAIAAMGLDTLGKNLGPVTEDIRKKMSEALGVVIPSTKEMGDALTLLAVRIAKLTTSDPERARLKELLDELLKAAKQREEERERKKTDVPADDDGVGPALTQKGLDFFRPIVSSMQRIGGAALGGPSLNLDRERNALLRGINSKIGQQRGAVYV